jgi:glycosyltransferase involved in cell wall biosynthesis
MVSVIITTFGDDIQYVPMAIGSCNVQNIETEVIVVECGSGLINQSEFNRFIMYNSDRFIVLKEDKGLAYARNRAIDQAKHENIILLDADDYFYPNVFKCMLKHIDNHDVVYGNMTCNAPFKESKPVIKLTKEVFLSCNPIFTSSMFTKKIWNKVGKISEDVMWDDYNFWVKIFKEGGKFKYLDEVVYHHTIRPDSLTKRIIDKTEEYNNEAVACLKE